MCAAGDLRGSPASTTRTRRRARDNTSAPDGPAADHHHVVLAHADRLSAPSRERQRNVPVSGNQECNDAVDDTTTAMVGDPRLRLKPRRARGRTVIPLTQQPGGVQARKIIIPASRIEPELRVHEGHEWLYVLTGRMRLLLGGHDLVLGPGEAAEFDTHVPHWSGSTGGESAEVLSLFGQQGERMHVRAKSGHGHPAVSPIPARSRP